MKDKLNFLDLIEFAMQHKLSFEEYKSLIYSNKERLYHNNFAYNSAVVLSRLFFHNDIYDKSESYIILSKLQEKELEGERK